MIAGIERLNICKHQISIIEDATGRFEQMEMNIMTSTTQTLRQKSSHLSIYALGMSLGLFLLISFALCVAFGLLFPGATMYQSWLPLLPGVSWISWSSFLLGLAETFAYGWFVAVVFVPLFNYFSAKSAS